MSRFLVTAKYFMVDSTVVDADSAADAERLGLTEMDPNLVAVPGTLTVETVEL